MRVGIDFRILSAGPERVRHGIGRYTQQQVREVLRTDQDNEYVILALRGNDLSLVDPAIRDAPNITFHTYSPPRELESEPLSESGLLTLSDHYQDWIYHQGIDVFHAPTPTYFQYPTFFSFDACPAVATLYDLIPLSYPDEYLDRGPLLERYKRWLKFVERASQVIAISDFVRDAGASQLGVPSARIVRAWPIPDPAFRPLPAHALRNLLTVIRSKIRLPEKYLLAVSAPHHSKNLETLFRGYSRLPEALRIEFPLVLVCHMDETSARTVQRMAAKAGVADDVLPVGDVSDDELNAIFNQATLVVHPSRHEGFGLPVVEAMRCGTPVITTTATALPEASGGAAVLVDPEDPMAFADAIASLLGDRDAREAMREHGFAQSSRFDAAQLAGATLAAYRTAARGHHEDQPPAAGPRLAVWAPLPPLKTGVADYSAELLGDLVTSAHIEVFVDGGYLPDPGLLDTLAVHHFSAFERRHAQAPFHGLLFQVGGSDFHSYMADALRSRSGVVVLHDLIWSNVLYYSQRDHAQFLETLEHLEGKAAVEAFKRVDQDDEEAVSEFLYAHPLLEAVLERSVAQIVHAPQAVEHLLARYPTSNPHFITMGVSDPLASNPGVKPAAARASLGLPAGGLLLGTFGIVHPSKRIESCIQALGALIEAGVEAWLVVVGRALAASHIASLKRVAEDLGVLERVKLAGHVSRKDLDLHIIASDVVVNLRTPSNPHMSATLMRALAAAKPVIISDLPYWKSLPGDACRRIPIGSGELGSLASSLMALAGDPGLRSRMSAAARAFYEEEGTIGRMSARYLEILAQSMLPAPAEAGMAT